MKNGLINPNELICFTDAYDTLLLRPLKEIEEYYYYINKLTKKKIIISSDDIKNPLIKTGSKFIFGTCKNLNINSGNYLGKAKDLLIILQEILNNTNNITDDQILFTNYCNINPNLFHIDNEKDMFLTIQTTFNDVSKYIDIEDNIVYYLQYQYIFLNN